MESIIHETRWHLCVRQSISISRGMIVEPYHGLRAGSWLDIYSSWSVQPCLAS